MGSITEQLRKGEQGNTPIENWEKALVYKTTENKEGLSKKNSDSYRKELNRFVNWLSIKANKTLTLDDLYMLGVEASKAQETEDRLIIHKNLYLYMKMIKDTKVSEKNGKPYGYGKMKEIKSAVFKFYTVNGITLTLDKKSDLAKILHRTETDKRKPTREEIKQLIAICPNLRLKSAVCLGKDSGLRCSDLVQVQYKHIKKALKEESKGFGSFSIITEKTDKKATPCFGSESTYYLGLWVQEYETMLNRKLTDDDYIFPVVMNYGDTKKYSKLDAGTLDQLINNQIDKLGLKGELSANGLRYFFQSNLETQLNKNIITKLQGKSISDSSSAYSKHSPEEMLELYKPVYHLLTVESGEPSQKAEITSMQTQINELKNALKKAEKHIEDLETDKPEPDNTDPRDQAPAQAVTAQDLELFKALAKKLGLTVQ